MLGCNPKKVIAKYVRVLIMHAELKDSIVRSISVIAIMSGQSCAVLFLQLQLWPMQRTSLLNYC